MNFPTVNLAQEFEAQQRYAAQTVHTLKIDDDVVLRTLTVYVQLGDNPSFKYWVQVLNPETYTVDWTNEMIANAITARFQQ
jgi:hypothetical protein